MARWYSEDPEYTEISKEEKELRDKIVAAIARYSTNMEGYSYFGVRIGVPEDDYEDIADDLMKEFHISAK